MSTILPTSLVIDGVRYVRAGETSELLTLREIAALLKLNAAHVRDRVVQRADFPAPAIDERNSRRWRRSAVEEWLAEQERKSRRSRTGGSDA